jgi:hypothetical protein
MFLPLKKKVHMGGIKDRKYFCPPKMQCTHDENNSGQASVYII